MAVGFFSEGVCWSIAQEAIDAHFQSIPPTILTTTSTQSVHEFVKQGNGVWNTRHYTQSSNGAVTQQWSIATPNPILISCTLPNDPTSQFLSGVELGWAVSAVLIIAYSIQRLRRGF